MAHNHHKCNNNCTNSNPSTQQTLDEFDFERGIWSAVLNKDLDTLEKHIQNGNTDKKDNSGYTGETLLTHFKLLFYELRFLRIKPFTCYFPILLSNFRSLLVANASPKSYFKQLKNNFRLIIK